MKISSQFILAKDLTVREIKKEYFGTVIGFLWSLISPILMIAIYAFVFSNLFKGRWSDSSDSITNHYEFAIAVFCGFLIFDYFSMIFGNSSRLILSKENYVKKVNFPLQVFVYSNVFLGLYKSLISLVILVVFCYIVDYEISWQVIFLLPILLVFTIALIGICFWMSASGLFFRDLDNVSTLLRQALFFLTPILYPIHIMPEWVQGLLQFNPLTPIVMTVRAMVMEMTFPSMSFILIFSIVSIFLFYSGHWFFKKTKPLFGDVI